MAATDDQRWRDTADRVELAELMHCYALAIDTAHFDDLREVFTADASVDFGLVDQHVEGTTGVSGIEAIVGWFRTVLAPFPDVLHFITTSSTWTGIAPASHLHARDAHGDGRRLRRAGPAQSGGLAHPEFEVG
jgi:SnoaL-like domain